MQRLARRLQPCKWPLILPCVTAGSVSELVSRTICWTSEKMVSTGLSSGLPLGKVVQRIRKPRMSRRVRPHLIGCGESRSRASRNSLLSYRLRIFLRKRQTYWELLPG